MAYGMGIARGLMVTFKHIFHTPVTVNYPEETRQVPVRAPGPMASTIWLPSEPV